MHIKVSSDKSIKPLTIIEAKMDKTLDKSEVCLNFLLNYPCFRDSNKIMIIKIAIILKVLWIKSHFKIRKQFQAL